MAAAAEKRGPSEEKVTSKVVVIYEDDRGRAEGVKFSDALIERFWSTYDFDVSWWSYAALAEARSAGEAVEKACEADLLVFVASSEGPMPVEVNDWLEQWAAQRGEREGALVDLNASEPHPADNHFRLREVAHRAKMDYLTQIPQNIPRFIPESQESYHERAGQVTSLLDEILHHQPNPPQIFPS